MRETVRRVSAISLIAIALAACAPAMVNHKSDEQSIRSVSNEWQRAIAARDLDRVMAVFAPDAVLILANNPIFRGPRAIRTVTSGMLGTPGLSMHWIPTQIEVASLTVATEYGTYSLSFDSPQGKVNDTGNYANVWHKVDGQWRVALHEPVTNRPTH